MSLEIGKLKLSPGDVLVMKIKKEHVPDYEKERIRKKVADIFGDDVKVLVYCDGEIELFIIESKKIVV